MGYRGLLGVALLVVACAPVSPSAAPSASVPAPAPPAAVADAAPPPAGVGDAVATAAAAPAREWVVAWQRRLDLVTQPPRAGNGLLYLFVSNDVLALDAATGEVRWRYTAPRLADSALALGCPCAATTADFHGRDVYVLAGTNELRALDSGTGQARWAQRLGQAITTPTVTAAGVVVVGAVADALGTDFALYGLDEQSGAVRWTLPFERRLIPWAAQDGATVLGATSDQRLVAVDAPSGRLLWTAGLPRGPALPPPERVGGGALPLGADSSVLLLDTATGAERWRAPVADWPGAPLLAGGRVFAATVAGQLVALDPGSGARLWSAGLGEPLYSGGLAHADGTVYVPTLGNALAAVDAAEGRVRWARRVGELLAAPVSEAGALLVGTADGALAVLDPASAEELARLPVGEAVRFSPLVAGDLVYVVADADGGSVLTALRPQAR
jgi:outer membrane protein assembly factor BamB